MTPLETPEVANAAEGESLGALAQLKEEIP